MVQLAPGCSKSVRLGRGRGGRQYPRATDFQHPKGASLVFHRDDWVFRKLNTGPARCRLRNRPPAMADRLTARSGLWHRRAPAAPRDARTVRPLANQHTQFAVAGSKGRQGGFWHSFCL